MAGSTQSMKDKRQSRYWLNVSFFFHIVGLHTFFSLLYFFFFLQLVLHAIQSKPGGQNIIDEYHKLKKITERQRKLIVNYLVAEMMEEHGYRTHCKIISKTFFFF